MSVTIKDVAERAGVSPSTVSRVISDNPNISEKTKKKVKNIMEEMGYHLNYNARSLAKKTTKTIGIVMKNSVEGFAQSSFFPEVMSGISAVCSQYDYSINLATGETEEEIFDDVVKMIRGKRVDGMLVLYSKKGDKVVPYLSEIGIPFVLIGKPLVHSNQIMYVDNDNIQAAYDATEYLISLGHKRIGFISGDPLYEVNEARLNGYKQALLMNGLSIYDEYIKNTHQSIDRGKEVIRSILELANPPTAYLTADDKSALRLLFILYKNNINVPKDVSIISFNNSINTELSIPRISTIDIQTAQLGYEAAEYLIEVINDQQKFKKSIIVPSVIIEKDSCMKIN